MFKDFQVKAIRKDIVAPANLLKKTLALVFSCEFYEL